MQKARMYVRAFFYRATPLSRGKNNIKPTLCFLNKKMKYDTVSKIQIFIELMASGFRSLTPKNDK